MKIAIGADHGGYEMKERMKKYIAELGHETVDVGTYSTKRCDYPDYAFMTAQAVSSHKCDVGIMIESVRLLWRTRFRASVRRWQMRSIRHVTAGSITAQICSAWEVLLSETAWQRRSLRCGLIQSLMVTEINSV